MNYYNEYHDHETDVSHLSIRISPSINIDGDIYDDFGRNYSAYRRRQDLIRWTTVYYHKLKQKKNTIIDSFG